MPTRRISASQRGSRGERFSRYASSSERSRLVVRVSSATTSITRPGRAASSRAAPSPARRSPSPRARARDPSPLEHDPPLDQHVKEVRDDVIGQPLVVRHDDHRALWSAQRVHAGGDDAQGVDVEPRVGLVQNREVGSRIAIWKISFRFFSPPENPSLTARLTSSSSMSTSVALSLTSERKSNASSSDSPRCLRTAFSAFFRK